MLKTKLEIIEETVAFYSEDVNRRAVIMKLDLDGDSYASCQYKTEDNRMCAVGRCLLEPDEFAGNTYRARMILLDKGIDILKPEYRLDDTFFWNALQLLHDTESHWDIKGLTEVGEIYAQELKQKYA